MFKVGFDNDLYIQKQSEQISKRIKEFGGKLYLEFGGTTRYYWDACKTTIAMT